MTKATDNARRGPKLRRPEDYKPRLKPVCVPPDMHALAVQMARQDDRTIGSEMSLLIRAEWARRQAQTDAT